MILEVEKEIMAKWQKTGLDYRSIESEVIDCIMAEDKALLEYCVASQDAALEKVKEMTSQVQ